MPNVAGIVRQEPGWSCKGNEYILGNEGRAFEKAFAAWLGAAAVVGCGNGTDSIALAPGGCPETGAASREILSLPLYPEPTDEEVATVCAALRGL
jgi:dTDP-4-amino-4,6-dideoxygalactose transaminase